MIRARSRLSRETRLPQEALCGEDSVGGTRSRLSLTKQGDDLPFAFADGAIECRVIAKDAGRHRLEAIADAAETRTAPLGLRNQLASAYHS